MIWVEKRIWESSSSLQGSTGETVRQIEKTQESSPGDENSSNRRHDVVWVYCARENREIWKKARERTATQREIEQVEKRKCTVQECMGE